MGTEKPFQNIHPPFPGHLPSIFPYGTTTISRLASAFIPIKCCHIIILPPWHLKPIYNMSPQNCYGTMLSLHRGHPGHSGSSRTIDIPKQN
jgi:hypothetical protein